MNYTEKELQEMIQQIETKEMLEAPIHLKENVLKGTASISTQLVYKTKKASRKTELILFSAKITAAAVVAILFLCFTNININTLEYQITPIERVEMNSIANKLNQKASKINGVFYKISNQILELEKKENMYDTEKK